MDDSPASRRKDRLEDLPGVLFEKIVCLLTFQEKASIRLVSKKWKAFVEYIFSRQNSIRISARQATKDNYGGNEMRPECNDVIAMVFSIDLQGFNSPFQSKGLKQSADRFVAACQFIMKYFPSLTIIHLPWGLRSSWLVEIYPIIARLVSDAYEELATHYGNQLQCFNCASLTITENHSFPELKHLFCGNISQNIHNMFETTTPKLQVLVCSQICPDNFQHLPQGFLRFKSHASHCMDRDLIGLMLKSKGREIIQSIEIATVDLHEDSDSFFPNLKTMKFRVEQYGPQLNMSGLGCILSRSEHLECLEIIGHDLLVKWVVEIVKNLKNLRELTVDSFVYNDPSRHRLMGCLSQLEKLERLDLCSVRSTSKSSVVEFLRGKSRKTLTHFNIGYLRGTSQVDDIVKEMKIMMQTEALVFGCVNDVVVKKGDLEHQELNL